VIYGLYHSAAGMMTSEYRQNVIANNLANAETVGFKQELTLFAERLPAREAGVRNGPSDPGMAGLSGGLWLGRTCTDYSQSSLLATGYPTDLALEGPGFLVVEVAGQPQYTRDGRFVMAADGQLRAVSDGAPALDVTGRPIWLNPHGGAPQFDEDGRVLQDGLARGRLALVDFEDYEALRKVGASRFEAGDAPTTGSAARVLSGHLESSGVEPVRELVSMLETTRAHEVNARMLGMQDQSLSRLISVIGR
jgi:flagellar basal body rod protein FlgG